MKILTIMLVFTASTAFAEIYTWSDAQGAHHYTNRADEIPVRYRSRAKSLNYGSELQTGASLLQRVDRLQLETSAEPATGRISDGNPALHTIPSHAPDSGKKALRQQRDERMQEKIKARAAGRASKSKD